MCRPIDKRLQKKSKLPKVKRIWTVEERLGGWDRAQKMFFGQGVSPCHSVIQKVICHMPATLLADYFTKFSAYAIFLASLAMQV